MRPANLLFILTDQQRYDTVHRTIDGTPVMPALSRFAESGTQFTRAYCSQPICTPARGTIMTGLWPHQHGCIENNLALDYSVPTIAEMAAEESLECAYIGKWHLGDELFPQHGFSVWESIEDQYSDYFRTERDKDTRSSYHQFLMEQGYKPRNTSYFTRMEAAHMPRELAKPDFVADRVRDYIGRKAEEKTPFMTFASFLEPHPPYTGHYDGLFDWRTMELPESFSQTPAEGDSLKAYLMGLYYHRYGSSGFPLETDEDWRRLLARYYGLCRLVDEGIKKILDTLEEAGLAENTIVVFTSDHGDQMGDHNCLQKGVLYEESVRVPMIIRVPGQQRDLRYNYPVSQIDLVPTLLDLMGEEIPAHLPGRSLAHIVEGETGLSTGNVVVQWNAARQGLDAPDGGAVGMREEMIRLGEPRFGRDRSREAVYNDGRSLVTPEGWKYNCYSNGTVELFDLVSDPHEMRNLSNDQQCIQIKKALDAQLSEWIQNNKDFFPGGSGNEQ